MRPTALNAAALRAKSSRNSKGTLNTHWRMGTSGKTRSVRCAAVLHIRRALQEGQTPRNLHENATSISGSPEGFVGA